MTTATKTTSPGAAADASTTPAPATTVPSTVTVSLQTPINRAQQRITAIDVRRPRTADLRGLNLTELLMLRTDSVTTLLPRITTPTLLRHEIDDLDPADFVSIATEVVGFLAPNAAPTSDYQPG